MTDETTRDFFISFTWDDVDIATALNDALLGAGFTTWFHPLDKPKGAGIADWMEVALDASRQMIAICSPSYFDRNKGYSRAERQSMFWEDPTNNDPLLILVKVKECKFPRLIAQNECISLIGMQPPEAADRLVSELTGEEARQARLAADKARQRPAVFNVAGHSNRYFTGRDEAFARLHENIVRGETTAITAVKGMGGIGKTTLAREYALRRGTAARFGGVWWVEAETEGQILASYDTLAGRLTDIERERDLTVTAERVREYLGARAESAPWLVIFDNAPDAKTIEPWLPGGSAKVIVTSRYQQFGQLADELNLDEWDEETTMRYLLDRAGRGTEGEARSLARKLDGLPLAAEQAGAFLAERPELSFAFYEARLIELLEAYPNDLDGRSVYATFAAAIEAVLERPQGDAALGILNICAFLSPEGVELELLTACATETEILPEPTRTALSDELALADTLRSLRSYALIKESASDTILLHRLLAEVARARLSDADREHWAAAGLSMIRALMPFNTDDDPSCWPLCAALTPHVIALEQLLDPGPGQAGKVLGYLLNRTAIYLTARGDFDGATDLNRRCTTVVEQCYGAKSPQVTAALGNLAGQLAEREETWQEAETIFNRALAIKEETLAPDDPSLAITLSNLGRLKSRQRDFVAAEDLTKRAAEIDKVASGEISAPYATGLGNLGAIYREWARETTDPDLRDKERAAKVRAAEITRQVRGLRHPETTARYNNLATMYADRGDIARAAKHMARCVAIELSLDQVQHPETQNEIRALLRLWSESGQGDKAQRLENGDRSDILPYVEEIEEEHRQWVAEDPENRSFGPPSPITGATE